MHALDIRVSRIEGRDRALFAFLGLLTALAIASLTLQAA